MKMFQCALVLAIGIAGGAASADVVTYQFTGTLTYAAYMAPVGSQIIGTFSYDTHAQPYSRTLPYAAHYQLPETLGLDARVGAHRISGHQVQVMIANDRSPRWKVDAFVYGSAAPVVDGTTYPNGSFSIVLVTNLEPRLGLDGPRLPHRLDLADFDTQYRSYGTLRSDGSQTGSILDFTIDTLEEVGRTR
ncbi:MAG: hypothetical protein K0S48_857 [Ramlibacter sp.]|jgi:hypothetical protein|nr:hypothetical protein [Ramlibacter sp.]MCE3272306.1 hypothetical protein [Ramlibacter sp.]